MPEPFTTAHMSDGGFQYVAIMEHTDGHMHYGLLYAAFSKATLYLSGSKLIIKVMVSCLVI